MIVGYVMSTKTVSEYEFLAEIGFVRIRQTAPIAGEIRVHLGEMNWFLDNLRACGRDSAGKSQHLIGKSQPPGKGSGGAG